MPVDIDKTRRQRIIELLRSRPVARPTSISKALDDEGISISPNEVIDEIEEIRASLDNNDVLYVSPAVCRDCGFDDWNDLVNIPSRCPEETCRSEWIEEPEFTIR